MTTPTLLEHLHQALAQAPDGALCVGFSGGPDSSALLHALAGLPEARARGLRAVHVDHALHADSGQWAAHCQMFCAGLDVPCDIRRVRVDTHAGSGLEATARAARYAAFADTLQANENLLVAHHSDDQAETVLLKLLRGAGPEGLGGMRTRRAFAGGWLWRPLLDTPRSVLTDYLREHAIIGIHDPANDSADFARNVLRHDILPGLAGHWPRAVQTIGHSAKLSQDAADFIGQHSREALSSLLHVDNHSLDADGWLSLHPALRGLVLEYWLHARGFTAPTLSQRKQLEHQIRTAARDRVPCVNWAKTAVHLWRGRLFAHARLPDAAPRWQSPWHGESLSLPVTGSLRMIDTDSASRAGSMPTLEVHLGETGIRLRPAGDRHTRELRDLFQQAGIPPWQRRYCPLIHATNGTLLAVADLWQTETGKHLFDALGVRPRWQPDA